MDKFYKTITTFGFRQEFYDDKNKTNIVLKPFAETSVFFRNHRMILKKKGHQYLIMQEADVQSGIPTIPVSDPELNLLFGILLNDTHYQMRTGLHFDPRRQKIVVSPGEESEVLVTEKNVMACISSISNFTETPNEIRDEKGNIVFKSEENKKEDFDKLAAGIYQMNETFFFKCNGCHEFEALFSIKLFPGRESMTQTITIPAGSYRWRYKIHQKFTRHAAISLLDENEKVTFSFTEKSKEDVAVFVSNAPVALSESPITSLVIYHNETILKKFLPVPSLENARFLSNEDKQLVLEAFVTI